MSSTNQADWMPKVDSIPAIHPLYLKLLGVLLQQRGVDACDVLADAGLVPADLDRDETPITLSALQAVASAALRRSGSPWLGLELGASIQAFSHGPLGYAAMASGSLLRALDMACRFVALRAPILRLELRRGGSHTHLWVHEMAELGGARRLLLEALVVSLQHLLQSMAGQNLDDVEFEWPWPQPSWSRHYSVFLGGRMRFGTRRLCIRYPNDVLDSACLSADPQGFELARRECERRLQAGASERDLGSQIRRHLWRCEGRYPGAGELAQHLGLSRRSFYRALAEAGVGYRGLLDEVRHAQAQRLLRETSTPIQRIAERLGYADASNFSRCFRRWQGQTPREFRRSPS